MKILTVKNRYREPFVGMYDGQEYVIEDRLSLPEPVAVHLKKQSIIRDNPITGDNDYRLAILELGDDFSTLDELPVESLDRSDMDYPKSKIVQTNIRNPAPMKADNPGNRATTAKN